MTDANVPAQVLYQTRKEQINMEYNTIIEEYKALRSEILSVLDSSRQMVNVTVTAIGILIAGSPWIIDKKLPSLFLIASLFLFYLSWSQIRYLYFSDRINEYLKSYLIPQIRRLLAELAPDCKNDFESVMIWEEQWRLRYKKPIMIPTAFALYGFPIFASIILFFAYFNYISDISSSFDYLMIILNIVSFMYSIALGIWAKSEF
jgi:hypothetical protein